MMQLIVNTWSVGIVVAYLLLCYFENYLKPQTPLDIFFRAVLWPIELLMLTLEAIAAVIAFLLITIHNIIPRRKK